MKRISSIRRRIISSVSISPLPPPRYSRVVERCRGVGFRDGVEWVLVTRWLPLEDDEETSLLLLVERVFCRL